MNLILTILWATSFLLPYTIGENKGGRVSIQYTLSKKEVLLATLNGKL